MGGFLLIAVINLINTARGAAMAVAFLGGGGMATEGLVMLC